MNIGILIGPCRGGRWLPLMFSILTLPLILQVWGQATVVYEPMPLNYVPAVFPYDAYGYRLVGLPGEPSSVAIDLNHDGRTDFTFVSGSSFSAFPSGRNKVLGVADPPDLGGYAIPLGPGESLGPNPSAGQWMGAEAIEIAYSVSRDIGSLGYWPGIESAYSGVEFEIAGEMHYGWIRLGVPAAGVDWGWIYDYGYETRPNTPIAAGAKPVSAPVAAPAVVRAGFLRLSWLSEIGKAYQVQSKPSLDAFAWTNLNFAVPATATNTLLDLPMSGATQFFRVVAAD